MMHRAGRMIAMRARTLERGSASRLVKAQHDRRGGKANDLAAHPHDGTQTQRPTEAAHDY